MKRGPDFLEFDMYIDDTHLSDLITVTPRVNKDHVLDRKGKHLLELCQATSLIIGNGRLHSDLGIGEYTCHTHNGASVVEYLLLNASDFKIVTEFYITRLNEFSDHCGVAFCLKTILNANETMNTDNSNGCNYVKFDIDKVDEFKNLLSNKMNVINEMLQGVETNTYTNSVVQSFTNFMHEVTHDVFSKTKHRPQTHKRRAHKMWSNADCYKAKKCFNKARNLFMRNKIEENKLNFLYEKRKYNRLKRNCKNTYSDMEKDQLAHLGKTKPRQFWKRVKMQYKKRLPTAENMNISDLYEHCKELYSTDT